MNAVDSISAGGKGGKGGTSGKGGSKAGGRGGVSGDAGSSSGGTAGAPTDDSGCGCSVPKNNHAASTSWLLGLALLALRGRRNAQRRSL